MKRRTSPASLARSRTPGLALLCAAVLMSGCASKLPVMAGDDETPVDAAPQRLTQVPSNLLWNRKLAVRTGSTPSFYADTPGRRTFGILGVIAMMRQGNQIVEDFGLKDPAGHLSEDLVNTLATRNGMQTSNRDAADLLLEVKTINWDFRPYRNDPDKLFVVYSARINLIDQRAGTILASGKCRSTRDAQGDSATLEQLLADGAERLHDELREAALECSQRMKSGTLSAFLQNLAPVAQRQSGTVPAAPLR
jgi:hypothetical protein